MIRKVEMERFTVISARPFNEVVAAIKTSIGNPDMAEFWKSTQEAKSAAELDGVIQRVLGRTGLMLFVEFDHGMVVRKGTERHNSRTTASAEAKDRVRILPVQAGEDDGLRTSDAHPYGPRRLKLGQPAVRWN